MTRSPSWLERQRLSARVSLMSSRLVAFDLMRGYFLLVILLNHLNYYPSGFEWITGQSNLYASTAEGFFLLSGIVLGMVRGAKLLNQPFKIAARLLVQRGVLLYVTSIILVILATVVGQLFIGNPGLKPGIVPLNTLQDWGNFLIGTVTLQYTYGWADYLRLYAIFLVAAPIALWLLRRGWWYVLAIISVLVWLSHPLLFSGNPELLQPLSWQLIFFAGFSIGFYHKSISAWWRKLRSHRRTAIIATISTIAVVTLIANVILVFFKDLPLFGQTAGHWDTLLYTNFDKAELPVPRLLLFGVWFTALYFLVSRFQAQITRFAGWLLLPFGTQSLYVYILEAIVVFTLHLIYFDGTLWYINLLFTLIAIGLVYLAVRTKFLMKIIPR